MKFGSSRVCPPDLNLEQKQQSLRTNRALQMKGEPKRLCVNSYLF